jgi:O-antigen/teichoic acid export membrane protein
VTVEQAERGPTSIGRHTRISGIVARLTTANVLGAASGFVTGPLLARALGPSGRGDLAAVIVPLALAPQVLSLAIPSFAYRAIPRGWTFDEVLGSLGPLLLSIGSVAAAAAVPIADALAGGRETVRTFLIIGLLATPLVLISMLLASSSAALERWRAVIAVNAIPFATVFAAVVVLYATGRLTVATAAAANIAGSLLTLVPVMPLVARVQRARFRLSLAREAISFGAKGWIGGLAMLANLRLDQFIMITAVSPHELGLYAVAVTIAGASGLATGALVPPLATRVASGQTHLITQAVRVAVGGTLVLNAVLALATPVLLIVLFGPRFSGAIPMALILLAAQVPFSGASVLSTALGADGAPLIGSVGEGMALVVTVVGLFVLLKPLGGIGAAIVSFAAYSTSFTYQLFRARRRTGARLTEFIVPTRADVNWAQNLIAGIAPRLRAPA